MEQLGNAFRTPTRVVGAFEFSSGSASGEEEEERAFDDDMSKIVNVQLPSGSTSANITNAKANANEVHAADANDTDSLQLSFPF